VIRGAVYQVDLGEHRRGHEQRGRRLGVLVSPTDSPLSVVTVVPTSTTAGPSIHRPAAVVAGRESRLLVDQVRAVDTMYVGDMVDYLPREVLAELDHALALYLGIG
jgi:mRNA interferase MazF